MLGALYESMLVVETKATGRDILARSICVVGFLTLWLREGGDDDGTSDRFMRLVIARARDILVVNSELSLVYCDKGPVRRSKGR